ncbi:unnamed protein product [Rhizophagus irregularis]|uniref:Uncharacterized protein n=1 Tax=Rhizophagus irregularis TaxID=588596 RepID=A0A2I1H671_9GLOM|nr:hypothetical protein RhiirA4_426734 [Rhizophagus irregularis]CAB4445076.1 unnamed protein product [Rhizophagus irregularis]
MGVVVSSCNQKKLSGKRLSRGYPIPEQLILETKKTTKLKKQNIEQSKSINTDDSLFCLWTDTNYKYCECGDILTINFTETSDILIDHCEYVDDFIISYVHNKIISVDIFEASNLLCCHLFDIREIVDNKPPLNLYSIYCKDHDELRVYFTDTILSTRQKIEMKDNDLLEIISSTTTLQKIKIEGDDILLEMDDDKKIVALWFCNANDRIENKFSKEDREKLIKKKDGS